MFLFSSPSGDAQIMIIGLILIFFISLIVSLLGNNRRLFFLSFSFLGNGFLFLNAGSIVFAVFDIVWLRYFVVFVWPVVNIFLLGFFLVRWMRGGNKKSIR